MIGKVKWFDPAKGFGFIQTEAGEEIYVHHSDLDNKAKGKELKEGQNVEFDVDEGKRGKIAKNVKPKV